MSAASSDRDLLGRLVSFDSTSVRPIAPIAAFCADRLDRSDVHLERFASADGSRVELLARRGPEPAGDGRGLVLCGHLDCVPAQEPEWESDPFRLVERDGSLFARGACDMKGSVAIAINAFLEADPASLDAPLWILLTSDEEIGSCGAARFVDAFPPDRPRPRSVLIGEPTSLRAVRMHKGHLKMQVTMRGRAAHSGSPHLGSNAIEPMGPILVALEGLRRALAEERGETSAYFSAVPFVALNLARLRGGTATNVVPDACVLDLGLRPMPGDDAEELIERVFTTVHEAAGDRIEDLTVEVLGNNPPMLLAPECAVHAALAARLGQTESYGVSYSSDAGYLAAGLGFECVLFGPGAIEVAHRPNEFVPIEEFERAGRIVRGMVAGFTSA